MPWMPCIRWKNIKRISSKCFHCIPLSWWRKWCTIHSLKLSRFWRMTEESTNIMTSTNNRRFIRVWSLSSRRLSSARNTPSLISLMKPISAHKKTHFRSKRIIKALLSIFTRTCMPFKANSIHLTGPNIPRFSWMSCSAHWIKVSARPFCKIS